MHSPAPIFCAIWATAASVLGSSIITTKVTPSYWRATLSSPPFNLMDNAYFEAFYALVDDIAADPDVKVVVFNSSVEDFFVAHFDILNPVSPDLTGNYWGNVTRLANLPVLTVAAIQGIARGGGAELAAALDVRFASKEKAIFGQPEVGIGVFPAGGGMRLLPRLVGRGRAMEIILGADDFDADTAALYGWINRAIPDDQFDEFIDTFARRVAGWDRYAIGHAKSIINLSGFPTSEEVLTDFAAFEAAFGQGAVAARVQAMAKAGFQTSETFEIHLNSEELRFIGPGPWDS
ncbi:ClpP/crotonase-like domain-containing protein [Xylaria sp. FL1042]|nr:ClpP/crotonase-like domain-containing protein [Xylaria sp. FL1042]